MPSSASLTSGSCHLCQQEVGSHPISCEALSFCCHGCQAVYTIISAQGADANFREHPLFLQAVNAGLISNPSLLQELRLQALQRGENREWQKLHFEIGDMWCPSCAEVITLVLLKAKGVHSCTVDYATDLALVTFNPMETSKEKLFAAIQGFGYAPALLESIEHKQLSTSLRLRFSIAAFSALNVMMFASVLYVSYFQFDSLQLDMLFGWLSLGASLPVVTYAAWPIWRRAWHALSVGIIAMEALVMLGVMAAFTLSTYELWMGSSRVYFDSMCVVITFVLLGRMIENKAKFSAKESLFRLHQAIPKKARRLNSDGTCSYLLAKEIALGDTIEVRMGETIPLDGTVVAGEGSCDESLMTGEPLPLFKQAASSVTAGSILQQGCVQIAVTALSDTSYLHRLVESVAKDIGYKSAYTRAIDPIVGWFVPTVIAIAAATILYCYAFDISDGEMSPLSSGIVRAVTICLISCPCAIGIAAPLAEARLIDAMGKLGAIVRNRGCLQLLGRETVVCFDKTGTVTHGHFTVISGFEELSDLQRQHLAALVAKSNHPIACAIARALEPSTAELNSQIEEFIGKGIFATFGNESYLLGSESFINGYGVAIPSFGSSDGKVTTVVYFATLSDRKAIPLTLGDTLRSEAPTVIAAMAPSKTLLLSGDTQQAAETIASQCGFSEFRGRCSPLEKGEVIAKLRQQGEIVSMVGDGINDSPALTRADLAISVVTASEISIHVSDILLTNDSLSAIPAIRQLARFGQRVIKQNLFWAFFYNVIGIALAADGWLSPLFAAFAMLSSSTIVLLNSKRIKSVAKSMTE